jgi:hypothetical protein
MFNVTSNTWFTVNLSQPRELLASTSSKNKIFFGGGEGPMDRYAKIVDIFCLDGKCPLVQSSASMLLLFISRYTNGFTHNSSFYSQVVVGFIFGGLGLLLCILIVIVILIVVLRKRKQTNKQQKYNSNVSYQSDSPLLSDTDTMKSLRLKPISSSLTLGLHSCHSFVVLLIIFHLFFEMINV